MKDYGKPVIIPTLSYDAIKILSIKHKTTIKEEMRRLLFKWTLNFWSNPDSYLIEEQEDEQ